MRKNYKVAVIGGGFSGLVCAERLSDKLGGEEIIVIERNDRVGKKILATGNGRGNITNLSLSAEKYHSQNGADVAITIEKYNDKSIIDYFRQLGMDSSTEDGKVYPSSFQANSILEVLRRKLEYLKTDIKTDCEVKAVLRENGVFKICTEDKEYFAEKVIFACGGKAGKQYGTDGTAYSLLQKFGHTVTNLYPSLVQVKTDTAKIKGLKGLKQQATVYATVNGKKTPSFTGDVLFTDFGVSGNAIFYLSAYLAGVENAEITVSFLPDKNKGEVACFIREKFKNLPYIEVEDVLTGVINKQIGKAIIADCGILGRNSRSADVIADKIKNFKLVYKGTLGFDNAQVTRGGIPFSEIDSLTMESRKQKDIYIIGEMLDVDGDCGGYNLQWAYSSARVAVDGVLNTYED